MEEDDHLNSPDARVKSLGVVHYACIFDLHIRSSILRNLYYFASNL